MTKRFVRHQPTGFLCGGFAILKESSCNVVKCRLITVQELRLERMLLCKQTSGHYSKHLVVLGSAYRDCYL